MGRRKTYDRDDVARRAMELFWQRGYEATTIQQLETTLRINRYSLFAEFGSKDGLFEAALESYETLVVAQALAALEAPDAGLDEIIDFLERFKLSESQELTGCLMCNTAVERAPDSGPARERVLRYFERLRSTFCRVLGDRPGAEATASALVSAVVGAFVQARGGLEPNERAAIVDGLVRWLRSLDPPG